jgi:uncharacterized membrane protein YphA (DoxX/SURF4 family)
MRIYALRGIFLVDLPYGFDIGHNGLEYALTQLLIALALLLTGAGPYSISAWPPARLRKL